MINDDSKNTSTATIIHEEVPLSAIKRRSSIFKPTIIESKNDNRVGTNEYKSKLEKEYKSWRELYLDIKNEYFNIKATHSKQKHSTEKTPHYSEDYQELFAKAENYVEKANCFFDQINCISTMNQNNIIYQQKLKSTLEVEENALHECFSNLLNKS